MVQKRYFIELTYKGTHYSGFQIQDNAPTVQGHVQQAFLLALKENINLTGSSRTDAGVHALQNFFHFDTAITFDINKLIHSLNAMLPQDIYIRKIYEVDTHLHARFSAVAREYKYFIIRHKDPFCTDTAYLFHRNLNCGLLNEVAKEIFHHKDFTSFSKLHTQVYTHDCNILKSHWYEENDLLVYNVKANRFLRGMVRALVATMLKVGTGKMSTYQFKEIIIDKDNRKAFFDAPSKGLFLTNVYF